jgi:hypothetical protein
MKNVVITACILCTIAFNANAQFSLGLKAGITSPQDQYKSITVGSGETAYDVAVNDIKFGTLVGGYMRFGRRIYLQPEVNFQTNRTDFVVSAAGTGESLIKRSSYQNLQIPLAIGIKMGPFRFHAAPVANYFLNGNSGLSDVNGFNEAWDQLTWGWLSGMTIGNGRLSADFRFEGNFKKFGDQITFLGDSYSFSQRPMSFTFAVNYALVK